MFGLGNYCTHTFFYFEFDQILTNFNEFLIYTFFSCKERDQYAKGCKSVSPSPFQMGLATALDPARDLQRLNTLIINNLGGFKMFREPDGIYSKELTVKEDIVQLRQTINALTEIAIHLDQIHRRYNAKLGREMQYGSRQAPIGDDNYLHLTRSGLGTTMSITTTSATTHQHHTLPLDKSPKYFIRNAVLRNSLTNDKFSQY